MPQPTNTIRVQLTIPAASITPSAAPASNTAPPPTQTAVISPSPTITCDQAAAGNPIDVTIQDDTLVLPGQSFTKIWRLQNAGNCIWSRAYAARFFYGNQMGAPDMVFLVEEVKPGGIIEIAIDMIAPMQPGTYQGNWKLRNPDGALFGIGPRGDSPFWVRIQVSQPETATPTSTTSQVSTPSPTETGTPSPTPTPEVLSSGTLTLKLNDGVDLDTGALNSLAEDDVIYRLDSSGFHFLFPINGAKVGVVGDSEPSPDMCRSANTSTAPLTLESLQNQVYLCYMTGKNRLGWLRFEGLVEGGSKVNLSFQTWLQP
jgi:hypothetical protein